MTCLKEDVNESNVSEAQCIFDGATSQFKLPQWDFKGRLIKIASEVDAFLTKIARKFTMRMNVMDPKAAIACCPERAGPRGVRL